MKPRSLFLGATAFGIALTAFVTLTPTIRFAYEAPALHVALETSAILIASFAGLLIFGRFRQSGSSQDLILVYVLGVLAMTNLFLAAVPALLEIPRDEVFLAWGQATARFVAGIVLAAAAFVPEARVRNETVAGVSVAAASVATLGLIALAAFLAEPLLPDPLGRVVLSEESFRPRVEGHPLFLALQLGQMAVFGLAGIGFLRTAERDREPMTAWVAAGCMLSALSRFNYFLFPSRYTDYVYVGDVLRLAFYGCLLVGAVIEINSYWRSLADARVGDTRRRLARDLHDGLAQELVFITAQTRRFMKRPPQAEDLQRLSGAADRAVAESRRAIDLLGTDREQTLREALTELAEETQRRVGTAVVVDAEDVTVAAPTREAVLRIAREALMNAVRHSGATTVSLSLRDGDPFSVTITDDGAGFDPDAPETRKKGFGLITMAERARGLGGEVTVRSSLGGTTEVELLLPKD